MAPVPSNSGISAAASVANTMPVNGNTGPGQAQGPPSISQLQEQSWLRLGALARQFEDPDRAYFSSEAAVRANPASPAAIAAMARVLMEREQWFAAVELWQRLLAVLGEPSVALRQEIWAEMGICWMAVDEQGKALQCLQRLASSLNEQGLDASGSIWWAIGLYHDRVGQEEAAIEAFCKFVQLDAALPISDRTLEAYTRLAILYRQRGQCGLARSCLEFVRQRLQSQPSSTIYSAQGLAMLEVSLQMALLEEREALEQYCDPKDQPGLLHALKRLKLQYERLLVDVSAQGSHGVGPGIASVLGRMRLQMVSRIRQRLGSLALQWPGSGLFGVEDCGGLGMLLKATEEDPHDALNWYFTGRLYQHCLNQPTKAYDAYQQAVYRDGRNPAFWNSIGTLYFGLGQYRDSLDAYTRAVHYAPGNPVIWWNLGLLYEVCNQQTDDAREAYEKARELAGEEVTRTLGTVASAKAFEVRISTRMQMLSQLAASVSAHPSDPTTVALVEAAAAVDMVKLTLEMDALRYVQRSVIPGTLLMNMRRLKQIVSNASNASSVPGPQYLRRIVPNAGVVNPTTAVGNGFSMGAMAMVPASSSSSNQQSRFMPPFRPPTNPVACPTRPPQGT